jgi:NADH:ubiquinone oxidoreductase subunit K
MKLEIKILVIWYCTSAIGLPLLCIFDKVSLNFSLFYFGLELWTLFILATIGDDEKLGLKKEIKSNLVKILISMALILEGGTFTFLLTECSWVRETDWGLFAVAISISAAEVLYISRRIFSFP